MTFYFTFGQRHPLQDNWIEIEAPSEDLAREEIHRLLSSKWSFLYTEETFKKEYFPGGKAGITVVVPNPV